MALQTGVLENGQWVTRNVDIYQLLALQNRLREDQPPRNPAPAEFAMDQPTVGLLSRTILRSPVVNWIIPARIRHREKNDVVFVGEDFIHLKEILPDANLRHVCTKADFGSRIRAARIFGEPRKFIHPDFQHLSSPELAQQYAESDNSIPPQFLVLTLESRELLFLFANEAEDGSIKWTETSLPLHPDVSVLESPGKHLAVDPRSRALAVGSSCNCILLYSAKSMSEVRQSMSSNPSAVWWTPLKTEMPIQVRGVILKMEFLFPDPSHDSQVVLIVLYARNGRTRVSCYAWDHNLSPKTIKTFLEGYPISSGHRRPQLLMPLQYGLSFVLVGKKDIDLYQNVLDGPTRIPTSLANPEPPRFPGNSRRFPVWTSWARTDRNFGRHEENFYLIREDGVVNYLTVNARNGALTSKAGHFDCNVSTAFASLDVGSALDTPDVLIAAGDSSPGEIVKIGQWKDEISRTDRIMSSGRQRTRAQVMEPDFITSVPDWSPTLDFIVANQPSNKTGIASTRKRILSTSGRSPYGSVSELRTGYDAKIGLFEEDSIFSGVTGLWSLPDANERGVFFLLSLPGGSELLHISDDAQQIDMGFDEETCGLDLSVETIACANIEKSMALQITPQSLVVVETSKSDQILPRKATWRIVDEDVLAASISPEYSTVYLAVRHTDGFSIRTMRVEARSEEVKFETAGAKPLPSDPTCVQFLWAKSKSLLLCATADGLIQLHQIHLNGSLGDILMSQNVQGGAAPGSIAACQSAIILRSHFKSLGETNMALVCGLRNGEVYAVDMSETTQNGFSKGDANSKHREDHGNLRFGKTKRTSIGHTPVVLFEDPETGPLGGFATCGSEFHRLNLDSVDNTGLEITNIWLTDRKRPYLQQNQVSAICRIPHEPWLTRGFGGALMCISGSAIYIVHVGEEKNMVPRKIPVRGSPNRVISCPSLKALFVACNEPVAFEVADRNGSKCSRFRESFIQMFDERGYASNDKPAAEYFLSAGWRINALSAIELEGNHSKRYIQVVIGAGTSSRTEEKAGRVHFLTRKIRENDRPELVQLKELKFKEQVTSLAPYGESNALLVCFGRKVHLYMFSTETRSLRVVAETEIPSMGMHVTAEDNHVYISTASDSLLVYQVIPQPEPTEMSHRFELLFTDSQARDTSCHVRLPLSQSKTDSAPASNGDTSSKGRALNESSVALVSDKRGSVAVLFLPHLRAYQTAVPTLVEAALPRSVMRLRRSTSPPNFKGPSSDSRLPGVLADDVIGAASDGTFFNFTLVEERTWRLLKFLENMCKLEEQKRRAQRPGSQLSPMLFDSSTTNNLIIGPLRHLDQSDDSPNEVLAAAATSRLAEPDFMDLDAESEATGSGPVLQSSLRYVSAYSSTAETLLRALDPDKNRTGLKRRTAYHIDGDILAANFVGRCAEESLFAMLRIFRRGDNGAVWKRFVELVDEALGLDGKKQVNEVSENEGIRAFEGMDISGASEVRSATARQTERHAQMRYKCRLVIEWLKPFMDPVL